MYVVGLNNTYINFDRVDRIRLYVTDKDAGHRFIVAKANMTDGRTAEFLIDTVPKDERNERLTYWRDELARKVSGVWKYEIQHGVKDM